MEHEDKPLLSVVLMGHVDAGKSTFAAHLLYKLGVISEHIMQQAESWSFPFSGASFKFARALNYISQGDFNGNNTKDKYQPLVLTFETEQWRCNLVDQSGFRDYLRVMIPHMISAHVGVLVVSAEQGEFEAGFSTHGQTREHALAAHLLGVPHLLVLVNKLDKVSYSATRYDEIRSALLQYLTQDVGYSAKHVTCVPVSCWTGDNLTARSTALPWYRGPDVLTVLEAVIVPPRTAQPLRVTMSEVYTVPGIGTVAVGRVEYGVLHVWDHVLVAPGNHVTQISSIEQAHQRREQALPGEEVAFCLPGLSATQVRRGSVLGHVQHSPPEEVVAFDAQIMVLNHPGQIRPGYAPLIACHNARVVCSLVEIRNYHYAPCTLDCESQPAFPALAALKSHSKAFVRFVPSKPMVLDDQLAPFNKFVGHDMRLIMLIGRIVKVYKKTQ